MKHMTIFAVLTGSLVLGACSSKSDESDGSQRVRLAGVVEGCKNVQTICAESYPPQCFDYCADEDPGTGGGDCQPIAGAYESCGDAPCAVGVDNQGKEFEVCYPPDCTVSYDVETKTETISCPPGASPGNPGGSDPGGSEPGNPGDNEPSGSEPGSPGAG